MWLISKLHSIKRFVCLFSIIPVKSNGLPFCLFVSLTTAVVFFPIVLFSIGNRIYCVAYIEFSPSLSLSMLLPLNGVSGFLFLVDDVL